MNLWVQAGTEQGTGALQSAPNSGQMPLEVDSPPPLLLHSALLMGALLAAFAVLVRFLPGRPRRLSRSTDGRLETIAVLGLEPRRNLYLVRVGSGYLLIGSSESGLSPLGSFDRQALEATPEALGSHREGGGLA